MIAAEAELELRRRRVERLKSYENNLMFYRKNPLKYFEERLGVDPRTIDWALNPGYDEHKWDGTPNPMNTILDGLINQKWVGVESATGTGKTFLGALIVFWFLECFENSLVVTTAPKQDQLTLFIWKEISRLYPKYRKGELINLKLRMKPGEDEWLAIGFVAGVKANEESATKAQGFHAEHMLIIIEETPGVPHQVITAFQNTSLAPNNLILAFGNPDHQLDNLHLFCLQDNVEHIRISAYDHPNIVMDNSGFIPGATSRGALSRMLNKYGEDNPLYLSRARGISPAQSKDSLIRIEWCMEAAAKLNDYIIDGKVHTGNIKGSYGLGVDVANSESGDKAAIAYGKGDVCYQVEDFQCPDSNQLGHQVYLLIKEMKIKTEKLGIDGVGVGAGTINTLKEYGITDKGINLQGAASPIKLNGAEEFDNLRSQMWWQVREDLRNGEIVIPKDEGLIADLTTPKYAVQRGKIKVESKDEIKKRLGRSPNKGDAFVYWNWKRVYRGRSRNIQTEIY